MRNRDEQRPTIYRCPACCARVSIACPAARSFCFWSSAASFFAFARYVVIELGQIGHLGEHLHLESSGDSSRSRF